MVLNTLCCRRVAEDCRVNPEYSRLPVGEQSSDDDRSDATSRDLSVVGRASPQIVDDGRNVCGAQIIRGIGA